MRNAANRQPRVRMRLMRAPASKAGTAVVCSDSGIGDRTLDIIIKYFDRCRLSRYFFPFLGQQKRVRSAFSLRFNFRSCCVFIILRIYLFFDALGYLYCFWVAVTLDNRVDEVTQAVFKVYMVDGIFGHGSSYVWI